MTSAAANRGLRVLVTGAADGVGLACAYVFGERGAEIILCDSNGTGLTRATDAVGGFSRFCDVVSEASVSVFADEIAAKFGSIDVLINAAGKAYVRTLGMMLMSRALLPVLRQGSGRRLIVNLAPGGGFVPAGGIFPYAGSREGFEGLSGALAEQTRGSQISVVAVAPRLRRGAGDRPTAASPFYRLERVDDEATAAEVLDLVVLECPEWRQRPLRRDRRA
jgi:NAD(P)-dependent dehydrogenase (short-subunit alcohol dehydrogenase family)